MNTKENNTERLSNKLIQAKEASDNFIKGFDIDFSTNDLEIHTNALDGNGQPISINIHLDNRVYG